MRKLLALSLTVVILAAGILVGCQNYDFEEVKSKALGTVKQEEPIMGIQKPAKIMLALDRSGSMRTLDTSDSQLGCDSDGAYLPSAPCKWNSVKSLLVDSGGFLDATAAMARHGLAVFADPGSSDPCGAGVVTEPVADNAGANIAQVKSKLGGYTPNGGTPSASTLRAIASDSNFTKKEEATKNYVVLITDGLPNCNSSISACTACTNGGDPTKNCGDVRNCLDDQALVSAVRTLKAKEIDTFVIGFGSAFNNPDAKAVLNNAAKEGGQPASDPARPDVQFYLAENKADLQKILEHITVVLQACNFSLDQAPNNEAMLEVSITDKKAGTDTVLTKTTKADPAGGDWYFNDGGLTTVTLTETWCKKLQEAPADTYVVNFVSVDDL